MGTSIPQALWGTGVLDGIDAATLHRLTHAWFAGEPLYSTYHRGANNPPATWIMLWPVFGWSDLATARQIWALLNLAALVTLAVLCARRLDSDNPWARACLFLAPFSMPALALALQVGQTTIVALSFALGAVLLARGPDVSWRRDLAVAAMFDIALIKPSCTAPLLWLLFVSNRIRAVALVVLGYVLLTVASAWFQPEPIPVQIAAWLEHSERLYARGYGALSNLAVDLSVPKASAPMALALLLAFGAWAWRFRRCNIWTLIAVGALVARVWIYHLAYDDALLVLALAAIVRETENRDVPTRALEAWVVLIALLLLHWTPLSLSSVRDPSVAFSAAHVTAWLMVLAALVHWASRRRSSREGRSQADGGSAVLARRLRPYTRAAFSPRTPRRSFSDSRST